MSPRAFAVHLPTALAAWLASFLAGCSGGAPASTSPATVGSSVVATAPAIKYVTHLVRPATDFKRIAEYFTYEEDTGGDIIVRTDTSDRRGLYFAVGFDYLDELPGGAIAVLEFVSSEKTEPQKFLFVIPPVAKPALFKELRLGVSGLDWPASGDAKITAWKLSLHAIKPELRERPLVGVKVGVVRASESATRELNALADKLSAGIGPELVSSQSFLWSLPKAPAAK